jgi:hypothetical protein
VCGMGGKGINGQDKEEESKKKTKKPTSHQIT